MEISQFNIEQVPIENLRPDPGNPRWISPAALEALTRSIAEFDLVSPIIARREDGTVIAGHQRLVAARRLGLKTVPTIYLDITAKRARLLGLALNRISGDFDLELLAHLLKDLIEDSSLDPAIAGFPDDEVHSLLARIDAREKRDRPEAFDRDAALRSAYEHPRAQRGDLFALGEHRVLCGDATDADDIARLLAGHSAAMAFLDPPYGVHLGDHGSQQKGQARRRLKNDSLSPEAREVFCRAWAQNLFDNLTGAAYICLSTANWGADTRVLAEAGGRWSDTLIWDKGAFVLGRADYQRGFEPLWYGWPQKGRRQFFGGRAQSDVWHIPRPDDSPLHPTTKPLPLIERAIENSSQPGDSVLDLFLGSGSTIVAAERTGRICYGLEVDEHYCSIAIARWEAFAGQKATKVTG